MKLRSKLVAPVVLAGMLFAIGGLGVARVPGTGAPVRATSAPVPAADALLRARPGGGLDSTIARLEERLREVPGDWNAAASLGLAYVQQARVTGDPSAYPKAEEAFDRSLRIHPEDNAAAHLGTAALAAARHDFSEALRESRIAARISPYDATVYGVMGDALLELGRYDESFDTFQRMVDLRPGLSSYARVSYARELLGDVDGAFEAMRAAYDVAGTPEDTAFAAYQLGELAWNTGRVARAGRAYRQASALDPGWPAPLAGRAKVAWARGDVDGAIAALREVVARYPAPEHVIALGDLLASRGDRVGAREQYALARAEARLFRANGVNVDLELALFWADHGRPAAALVAASDEWERRRSIHVADAYAWALHAAGRDRAALSFADRALALGTRSASFHFHRGMIEAELGMDTAARRDLRTALAINARFSILGAPVADATLRALEARS